MTVRRSIEIIFAPCDVCGKKDGKPGHDCDGGEALRNAAHELFAPTVDLIERTIAKAGTGVLKGVFEVAFERDALKLQRDALMAALADARLRFANLADAIYESRDHGRHEIGSWQRQAEEGRDACDEAALKAAKVEA